MRSFERRLCSLMLLAWTLARVDQRDAPPEEMPGQQHDYDAGRRDPD